MYVLYVCVYEYSVIYECMNVCMYVCIYLYVLGMDD